MQIVLSKDIPKLGHRGEVVKVREGYFRNFLLPQGFALVATPYSLKVAAVRKERVLEARKKVMESGKDVLAKLKGLKLNLKAKISSKGKLFGAIAEDKIVEAIAKATDLKLDRGFVKMTHIKTTGTHDVLIHLAPDMEEKVRVTVKAL